MTVCPSVDVSYPYTHVSTDNLGQKMDKQACTGHTTGYYSDTLNLLIDAPGHNTAYRPRK